MNSFINMAELTVIWKIENTHSLNFTIYPANNIIYRKKCKLNHIGIEATCQRMVRCCSRAFVRHLPDSQLRHPKGVGWCKFVFGFVVLVHTEHCMEKRSIQTIHHQLQENKKNRLLKFKTRTDTCACTIIQLIVTSKLYYLDEFNLTFFSSSLKMI